MQKVRFDPCIRPNLALYEGELTTILVTLRKSNRASSCAYNVEVLSFAFYSEHILLCG